MFMVWLTLVNSVVEQKWPLPWPCTGCQERLWQLTGHPYLTNHEIRRLDLMIAVIPARGRDQNQPAG